MRKFILALSLIIVSVSVSTGFAQQAPRELTLELYNITAERSTLLMDLFATMEDPIITADLLDLHVNNVLSQTRHDWMEVALANGTENYEMFLPCYEASYELGMVSFKIQRYLRQIGNEKLGSNDLDKAQSEIATCEIALGLDPSF